MALHSAPCFDPDCVDEHGRRSLAEPEQDGDHHYLACPACGSAFGYRKAATPPTDTGCAVGIPEAVRRRASAYTTGPAQPLPLLTIGRRPDATAP